MPNKIVIPTPVQSDFTGKEICFDGFNVINDSLPAPYALEMGQELLKNVGASDLVFSKLDHKNPQAYKISISDQGITIQGASDVAFIYAMSTLLQLATIKDDSILLPAGEVFDYPEFEYRGVNWNLMVECRAWSQETCDGKDAFISRFINALDTLAFFKLNVAFADGFGWNPERFPGYGELMRNLNHQAKERGIKLIFGGYNAGYGAQWRDFDGPVFRNRKSYPDGEVYHCMDALRNSAISSTMGTCLSNQLLNDQKSKNLSEFVKTVEPGMLYIHGIDISTQDSAEKAWTARCPDCRKRWPNDDVNAVDGMAGAFAEFYSALYEAVSSVTNPETGYDASKDCIVNMVSPNYTDFHESDEDWKYHLDYFKILSSHLKSKNIFLTLREQFFNYKESGPRFKQLREAVGKDSKLSVVYFSSGSSFYNSLPVTADPACIRYFEGLDSVIAGSGNAFQESRQGMYAEYMWNPKGSAFQLELPERGSSGDFLPYYHRLSYGQILPEEVFGENGLLEAVCRKLYGSEAAKLVASAQCPQEISDFELAPIQLQSNMETISIAPLAPIDNKMLPGHVFFILKMVYWREDLSDEDIKYAERGEELMTHLIRISDLAASSYRNASLQCESELPIMPSMRKNHLDRMAETCSTGARLAEFTQRWLQLFIQAYKGVTEGADKKALYSPIELLRKDLTEFVTPIRDTASKAIDMNKGDTGQTVNAVDFLLKNLENISHTLQTGEYLEMKKDLWW